MIEDCVNDAARAVGEDSAIISDEREGVFRYLRAGGFCSRYEELAVCY